MKKINDTVLSFILFTLVALTVLFSPLAKQGAKEGFYLCENIIIPSLLPVLILCSVITKSYASRVIEKIFSPFFTKVLYLPPCCSQAVILGLIGGYPAGAILTHSLYKDKLIDRYTAQRLMRFNFSGGIAFTVSAVGEIIYKSRKAGFLLFFVSILTALIIALLTRKKRTYPESKTAERIPFSDALVISVEQTVKSLAVMSAYIILFSALKSIFSPPRFLIPLIEITNGVCTKTRLPLPFLAFFMNFGGFCIHFQLMGFFRDMKIKYFDFLLFRVLSAGISYLLLKLFFTVFPQSEFASFNISDASPVFFSNSVALSSVMIIGCAVVIFDIENRKLKLT